MGVVNGLCLKLAWLTYMYTISYQKWISEGKVYDIIALPKSRKNVTSKIK